jgi:hypothetical protein
MLINVDGRNCSAVKKSVIAHSLKHTSSISTGTEPELWTAMGSRFHVVEWKNCVNVWNWFYAVFHYCHKKCDTGGKVIQIIFVVFL